MPPHELLDWLNANPFTPFRLHLTDGRTVDIVGPNQMLPGRQSAVIGIPLAEDPRFYDRHTTVSLLHVASIEPITTTSSTNG